MEEPLDKLKQYASILEAHARDAHIVYERGSQRPEDLPFAVESLKEHFYKLFPKAKKEELKPNNNS